MRILRFVLVLALAVPATALAVEDVDSTKHNLSTSGTGTYHLTAGTTEVCVFCHTPHGGLTTVPLWNHTAPAGPYTMYTSSSIDMTIATTPGALSKACLSCHDGTVGMDTIVNAPGSGLTGDATWVARTWLAADNTLNSGAAYMATDLSDDHPVAVTYNPALDTAFQTLASVQASSLRLFGAAENQVECASCHNPHEATLALFYRMSNAASAMCTTCHIK